MEDTISITLLNDFIFCPVSIYFHNLDYETEKLTYQNSYQINGTKAHEKCDNKEYSDKKTVLQGFSVYSEKYNLYGKIDTFDIEKGILTERKKKINRIYDGYIYQLYAQYFSLKEMGYKVNDIRLYSMDDNKVYKIDKPEDNILMFNGFIEVIKSIDEFQFNNFKQNNIDKCKNCIYEELCSYSIIKNNG